ncbi:MAG TPA: hypothetical protein VMT03_02315 [Polyangia bacterium]|nr:hypothetical protein [Polyangia bacterium]
MRTGAGFLVAAWLLAAAGCGSGQSSTTGSGLAGADARFAVCQSTAAVDVAPGISVTSMSGAYRATLQSASTIVGSGSAPLASAAIGYGTFTIAVAPNADAGTPGSLDGLTMSIPAVPTEVPADPYMPQHGHGGSTIPSIAPQDGGVFAVSNIDFFMAGWWQLYLDLQPADGSAKDRVTFDVCIPND